MLKVKKFDQLSNRELHAIYSLRTKVFVVEQKCPYQEVDAHDLNALHVFVEENGGIKAYARVLPQGETFKEVSIGRVIALNRGQGDGERIMRAAIAVAYEHFGADAIRIEAQTYAIGFYERLGFKVVSDEFDDGGIMHVEMLLEKD